MSQGRRVPQTWLRPLGAGAKSVSSPTGLPAIAPARPTRFNAAGGWRLAIVIDHGQPDPGTTLFTIPIDPSQLAASQARYALMQLPDQGLIAVGEAAAFS
jgi:hypothetical protein